MKIRKLYVDAQHQPKFNPQPLHFISSPPSYLIFLSETTKNKKNDNPVWQPDSLALQTDSLALKWMEWPSQELEEAFYDGHSVYI